MKHRFSNLKHVKGTYLLLDLLWLLAGLVLLIWPRFSSGLVCTVLGVLCCVYGVVKLFGYFSRDPYKLAFQFDLALGIFFLILGGVLLFFSETLLSLLPVFIGVLGVVNGVFRFQSAMDARRFGLGKWWVLLLLSLAATVPGVILLLRPFQSAMLAIRFVGLTLLINGVQDMTATAYTVNTKPNGIVIDVDQFREV